MTDRTAALRAWAPALGVVAIIGLALVALAVFGGRTLPDRSGPPIERLSVERTELTPGVIALTVRNTGPDPVQVAQVFVNDAYVDFTGATAPIERLDTDTLRLDYPWQAQQPYLVSMLTSTGAVITHDITAAVATPKPDGGFFALMTLLGTYVGIIPVVLGMLFLPTLRRIGQRGVRVLLAVTVGLLVFLAVDATFEGIELADRAGGAFGGAALVVLGGVLAFLALTAVDHRLRRRGQGKTDGTRLALMIAVGIGLHNLGEGLAIGSAYAVGELALGVTLVIGFTIQNTTEGLAIVTPLTERRPSLPRLLGLGVLAGAPAILGALIGGTVSNTELSAFLLGIGVGAIIQVVIQIAPALRDKTGKVLDPAVIGGIAAGLLAMYGTGLLVAA
ncbi:ZIP family metal transporter [Amycolatopsis sp. WAC 04169]|uniref:ZIP family metal transporter n=1 Tax=Amycolatopsis sp. WAC 04169 TaxID=2203197 RepID=UPI000F77BCA6|nr:ZIP family metal transporter [Amycolatopsis sp. WAC 04169]RSN26779.1 ZIP family metal transporter [Amycolatopsis sp. WAC 04169]